MIEERVRGVRIGGKAASAKRGSSQDIGELSKRPRSAGAYTSGGASSSRDGGPKLQSTSKAPAQAPPPPPKPS
eukprot:8681326-Karenia_brevis.AAC.1